MQDIILIICTGYFGDVLLTSKLTRDIKKYYPEFKLVYICDTPYINVARNLPGVEDVIPYNREKNSNIFKYLKFIFKFPYKNHIKHTFIIHQNKKSRIMLAKHLGAKGITTWESFKASPFYKKLIKEDPKHSHIAYFNADLLGILTNKKTDDKDIEFLIPEEIQKKVDDIIQDKNYKNLIAINPQANDETKCWEVEEFVKLTKILIKSGKTPIITGVSKDGKKYIESIKKDKDIKSSDYINLFDKTSFCELGAWYKRCEYVVSIDTGTAHMASAVGVPVLDLFFRNDAHLWSPINTEQNSFIYKDHITAEDVVEAIKLMLNKPLTRICS